MPKHFDTRSEHALDYCKIHVLFADRAAKAESCLYMNSVLLHPLNLHLMTRDFFIFLTLKLALKRRRSDNIFKIQEQSQAILSKFKTKGFCKFFQQWYNCWTWCLKLQENYFEGYNIEHRAMQLS